MTELTPDQRTAIAKLLGEGKTIEAIKFYRDATGSGLKESKEAVDTFQVQLAKDQPELYQHRGGCLGVLLVGVAVALGARWIL